MKESRVKLVGKENEEFLDLPACLEQKDHRVPREAKAQEVKLGLSDRLEKRVKLVRLDSLDILVHQERRETKVNKELMVTLDQRVKGGVME